MSYTSTRGAAARFSLQMSIIPGGIVSQGAYGKIFLFRPSPRVHERATFSRAAAADGIRDFSPSMAHNTPQALLTMLSFSPRSMMRSRTGRYGLICRDFLECEHAPAAGWSGDDMIRVAVIIHRTRQLLNVDARDFDGNFLVAHAILSRLRHRKRLFDVFCVAQTRHATKARQRDDMISVAFAHDTRIPAVPQPTR